MDSAGVRVVDNRQSSGPTDPQLQFEPEPVFLLGFDNSPGTVFHDVEGALLTSRGELVVANGGTRELRFFDSTGRLSRVVGGEGDGPGEYRWIASLEHYRGDSLMVYDNFRARVSIYDADGTLGRTFGVRDPAIGTPRTVLPLGDGSLIAVRPVNTTVGASGPQLAENRVDFHRFSDVGEPVTFISSAPGDQLFMLPQRPGTTYSRFQFPAFAHRAVSVVSDDRVVTRAGMGYSLMLFDAYTGKLASVWHRSAAPRSLSEHEVDVAYSRMMGLTERIVQYPFPYPESEPPFGDARSDDAGNVWVSEYVQRNQRPRVWSVFRPDGVLVGDVTLPLPARIHSIAAGLVVAEISDEFDVEGVIVWRLPRGLRHERAGDERSDGIGLAP